MGILTFSTNVTLDGCCDHREGIADEELHDYYTQLVTDMGAMLFGRNTYELMEEAWPSIAKDPNAPRSMKEWAVALEALPKYVVSTTRREYPWVNSFHLDGDLATAVKALKEKTPKGVGIGAPKLATDLEKLGLIDEYRFVVHPILAGHGPTLVHGLERSRKLELIDVRRFKSGAMAMHYRRQPT